MNTNNIIISKIIKREMRNELPAGRRIVEKNLNTLIETNTPTEFYMDLHNFCAKDIPNWPVSCNYEIPYGNTPERQIMII